MKPEQSASNNDLQNRLREIDCELTNLHVPAVTALVKERQSILEKLEANSNQKDKIFVLTALYSDKIYVVRASDADDARERASKSHLCSPGLMIATDVQNMEFDENGVFKL